jgi:hypothetical protein
VSAIETKVIAAAAGSGLGAALSTFLLWILGVTAFGASSGADQVAKALAAVPEPVGALLAILVGIGGAGIGGYVAPHTSRPDLATGLPVVTITGGNSGMVTPGSATINGTASTVKTPDLIVPGVDPIPPAA